MAIPLEHAPRAGDSLAALERSALATSGETPSSVAIGASAPTPAAQSTLGRVVDEWRRASLPKRAVALLMLPALIGALFTMRAAPAGPHARASSASTITRAEATPAATATGATAAAATATGATAAAVAAASGGAPDERAKAAPAGLRDTRSAERRALDTAASGLDSAASEQYAALAAAHPDNPAFREAARILHERAAASGRRAATD